MRDKANFFQNVVGMLRDELTPKRDKWLLLLGVVYILSPIDLIPDFLPVFGFVDDFGVLLATLNLFRNMYNSYVKRTRIVGEP